GVLAVWIGREAVVAVEFAGGPLPDVADHSHAAAGGGAGRIGAGRSGATSQLVHVGMDARNREFVPPRVVMGQVPLLVPGRRLLPLGLGGEAGVVRTGEGVGLEPGDVDDGPVEVERFEPAEAPLRSVVRRPGSRSRDVVLLLPRPALVGPPLAPLVPPAL